jgi:hypothetical protein
MRFVVASAKEEVDAHKAVLRLFSKLFRARLWFAPAQLVTSGKDKDSEIRLATLIWVNLFFALGITQRQTSALLPTAFNEMDQRHFDVLISERSCMPLRSGAKQEAG